MLERKILRIAIKSAAADGDNLWYGIGHVSASAVDL
jgi:hypothetical protein